MLARIEELETELAANKSADGILPADAPQMDAPMDIEPAAEAIDPIAGLEGMPKMASVDDGTSLLLANLKKLNITAGQ